MNFEEFCKSKGLTKQILNEFGAIVWCDGKFTGPKSPWVYNELVEHYSETDSVVSIRKVIERKAWRYKQLGANAAVFVPIFDLTGDFYGLSIRVIGSEKIKHDSFFMPEKSKSNVVFNLNRCYNSIKEKNAVFICEGAYDAIALSAAGQKNAICLLGTAFHRQQLFQLKCFTDRIVMCTDPDNAGLLTISKMISKYKDWFSFYKIDIDTDPDEYLTTHTLDDLKKTIVPIDVTKWLTEHPLKSGGNNGQSNINR